MTSWSALIQKCSPPFDGCFKLVMTMWALVVDRIQSKGSHYCSYTACTYSGCELQFYNRQAEHQSFKEHLRVIWCISPSIWTCLEYLVILTTLVLCRRKEFYCWCMLGHSRTRLAVKSLNFLLSVLPLSSLFFTAFKFCSQNYVVRSSWKSFLTFVYMCCI